MSRGQEKRLAVQDGRVYRRRREKGCVLDGCGGVKAKATSNVKRCTGVIASFLQDVLFKAVL